MSHADEETLRDSLSRLQQMAFADAEEWELTKFDQAALVAVLTDHQRMAAALNDLHTAPPLSDVRWHLGYEVGYREGESSHRADVIAAEEEFPAASPLAWEPIRALIATWRADAERDDADRVEAESRRLWVTAAGFKASADQRRADADELEALLPLSPAPKAHS